MWDTRGLLLGHPAGEDGFLKAIKIRSTTSFGGEVKPAVPFRESLWNVKNPYEYELLLWQNTFISRQASPASLLDVSTSSCQRALVDKSVMKRNQMGRHNRSEIVPVQE
jgi:hypothetical protein